MGIENLKIVFWKVVEQFLLLESKQELVSQNKTKAVFGD